MTTRRARQIAAGILALHAVLAWLGRLPGVSYSNDDAVYMLLAKSLRSFRYLDSYLPGAPVHVQYPPGWPAMLALVDLLPGDMVAAAYVLVVCLSLVGLWCFFEGALRVLPPVVALLALAASATTAATLMPAGRLMSEASFFCFTMVSLWAAGDPARRPRWLLMAGVAAILAAYMRSIGIGLLGALVLTWLMERRWRAAVAMAIGSIVAFGPWVAWSVLGPQRSIGRSYGSDIAAGASMIDHAGSSVAGVFRHLTDKVVLVVGGDLSTVTSFIRFRGTILDNVLWLLVLVGLGGWGTMLLLKRWRAVPLYVGASLGLLVLWTWSTRRFLFPLVPAVTLILLAGAWRVWDRFGKVAGSVAFALVLAGVPIRGWPWTVNILAEGLACDRSRQYEDPGCFTAEQLAFFAAAQYAHDSMPATATFSVDREASFAFHADRSAIYTMELLGDTTISVPEAMRARDIPYILMAQLTDLDEVRLPHFLAPDCEQFAVVKKFGSRTLILRLVRKGGDACPVLQQAEAESRPIWERWQRRR